MTAVNRVSAGAARAGCSSCVPAVTAWPPIAADNRSAAGTRLPRCGAGCGGDSSGDTSTGRHRTRTLTLGLIRHFNISVSASGGNMARMVAVRWVAVVVLAALPAAVVQAADAAAGQAAYAVCAACHGADGAGNQAMNAPAIAGQQAWYVKRQLEAYRNGLRGTAPGDIYGMQMRPMAMTVSDPATVDNLVAYIESLPASAPAITIEGNVEAGKAAYALCAACHGANAEGNEQMAGPALVGQSDWYLVRQINNYKNNLRGYDPKDIYGNQMKPMAATLPSDQVINDVVAYINSLR
jgi:cytochrome c553